MYGAALLNSTRWLHSKLTNLWDTQTRRRCGHVDTCYYRHRRTITVLCSWTSVYHMITCDFSGRLVQNVNWTNCPGSRIKVRPTMLQIPDNPDLQSVVRCRHDPNYYYYARLTALFPGLPRWAATRKVKPIWILLKQETVSGSGISWAICKSAPRTRQITTPALHHSCFFTGRMPFLPPNQQRQSTEGTIHTQAKYWDHRSRVGQVKNPAFQRQDWKHTDKWAKLIVIALPSLAIQVIRYDTIWDAI